MRTLPLKFASSRDGNFGIISAVLAVPLVLAIGVALDFSSISSTRATLQHAVDAAVLAIAREGKDISDADAAQIAAKFLQGNFDPKTTRIKVAKNGTSFSVSAATNSDLAFGGLLGYQNWPVSVAATADIAYSSYEIALVLDTTGSMKGGKLAAMKDAVIGLVDTMSLQVKDKDKLSFAMVPFSAFVNVGPQYGPAIDKKGKMVAGTGAKWLDLDGKSNLPQSELGPGASRFQIYANLGKTWPGCVETRFASGNDLDVDDTAASQARPETLFVPAFAIDEPDTGAFGNSYITSDAKPKSKDKAEKKKRWTKYGVKSDGNGDPLLGGLLDPVTAGVSNLLNVTFEYKKVKIDDSLSPSTGQPKGPGSRCDSQPIAPLSNDYAGIKTKVNALQASGNTNIMEGVAWGNRVLSPGEPFDVPVKSKTTEQIMIVLTDGSNVFGNATNELGSNYSSNGYLVDGRLGIEAGGASATNQLMNARTLQACQEAKDAGVEVYTIRLEEPNVATGNMLKECASGEDHYIDVPNRAQLDKAFEKIKETIVRVRMSS